MFEKAWLLRPNVIAAGNTLPAWPSLRNGQASTVNESGEIAVQGASDYLLL
jgi:hypothetical protein